MITLDELSTFEEFLKKLNQFGWLGTPVSSSPSQFSKLSNDQMKDHEDS